MSEGESRGTSIGDAIAMMVVVAALILFFIAVAILTFLASPGMLIVGTVNLVFGLGHSGRQLWVLSIAMSATILIALVFVRRSIARGVAAHLLICAATMIFWSLLTYGFESRATEALAAVFFPGFTIKEVSTTGETREASKERTAKEDSTTARTDQVSAERAMGYDRTGPERNPLSVSAEAAHPEASPQLAARNLADVLPEAEPLAAPMTLQMTSFRVAFELPIKRAHVMVRVDDREVFRCDFRPKDQGGVTGLVTPPIEAKAGPIVVKVWVISPDKREADEYLVLPVDLGTGESHRLSLVFDPSRELKGRLIAQRG